jgi:hypothetical protein
MPARCLQDDGDIPQLARYGRHVVMRRDTMIQMPLRYARIHIAAAWHAASVRTIQPA